MRKKFSTDFRSQIENGEYKPVLECGCEARILAWDVLGDYPIVCIPLKEGGVPFKVNKDGEPCDSNKSKLMVEIPEELTEFERVLTDILVEREYKGKLETDGDIDKAYEVFGKVAQELSPRLFAAAKKQIDSHFDDELKEIRETTEKAQYQRGYTAGKADALEDIPQWHYIENGLDRKVEGYMGVEKRYSPIGDGSNSVCNVLRVGNRYLIISELMNKLMLDE